jgi:hypothetical protein
MFTNYRDTYQQTTTQEVKTTSVVKSISQKRNTSMR